MSVVCSLVCEEEEYKSDSSCVTRDSSSVSFNSMESLLGDIVVVFDVIDCDVTVCDVAVCDVTACEVAVCGVAM